LQHTGRASYVAVNPTNGAIAAWLNGCNDLGAPNGNKFVFIMLEQETDGLYTNYTWRLFDTAGALAVEVCNGDSIKSVDAGSNVPFDNLPFPAFPPSINDITAQGIADCTYTGSSGAVGTFQCPDLPATQCEDDNAGDAQCGDSIIKARVKCRF
jgi:hypothetical protein